MRWLSQLLYRAKALFMTARVDTELSEEIRAHVEMATEANIAAGMSPEEAHYAALREFGGVEQIKERTRDERGWFWLEGLWRDLRFSIRSLRKSMAFSVAVIVTLALCVGANTTIFSVLYGLILKPLPFPDPGQVVEIYNTVPQSGQMKQRVSAAQYLDYRENADLFEHVALMEGWMFNVGDGENSGPSIGMMVTPDYFAVLGIKPLLGRFFTQEECVQGSDDVVVLTQSFWERHFDGDPKAVGQTIRLSRRDYTIIGVTPRSLEEMSVAPVLIRPMVWPEQYGTSQHRLLGMAYMFARIKPGVAHGAALAQLQTLEDNFRDQVAIPELREYMLKGGHRMALGQMRAEQTKSLRQGLLFLQGGALLVLLLGCVNVANLAMARVNTRREELAVRQALGASRGALMRQIFVEAGLLAMMGCAFALVLSRMGLHVINTYTATIVFGSPPVVIDTDILVVTMGVMLGLTFLIGLLPAIKVWRMGRLPGAFEMGARGTSRGRAIRAMSGGLVVAQMALALLLLIGAGLLIRSFAKVMAIDPGFDAERVIHIRVTYDSAYKDFESVRAAHRQIMDGMRGIPGVESVACSLFKPGYDGLKPASIPIEGMEAGQEGTYPAGILLGVSPEFMTTMGIRLLEGRDFTAHDLAPGARPVCIVDRHFAERNFTSTSAVGRMLTIGAPGQRAVEIVGVADVAKFNGLDERDGVPYVYVVGPMGRSLMLRTTQPLEVMLPLMRGQLRRVDPGLSLGQIQTMQMHLDELGANRRGIMWLLAGFAGIALLLATMGIYGLLAYDVTQRTREIGIRGAIGATRRQIVLLILRQGAWKAGIGLVIGLVGALGMSRLMEGLLYGVAPRDPLIFVGVAILLMLVSLIASWLPARRAAKVDPMTALRSE